MAPQAQRAGQSATEIGAIIFFKWVVWPIDPTIWPALLGRKTWSFHLIASFDECAP